MYKEMITRTCQWANKQQQLIITVKLSIDHTPAPFVYPRYATTSSTFMPGPMAGPTPIPSPVPPKATIPFSLSCSLSPSASLSFPFSLSLFSFLHAPFASPTARSLAAYPALVCRCRAEERDWSALIRSAEKPGMIRPYKSSALV